MSYTMWKKDNSFLVSGSLENNAGKKKKEETNAGLVITCKGLARVLFLGTVNALRTLSSSSDTGVIKTELVRIF